MNNEIVMEAIVENIESMSQMEIVNALDMKPGAAWESYDEMLANADFNFLKEKLAYQMFEEKAL
jgi:hypothetical protein